MTDSTKRALLNFLTFLKDSGYIYVEPPTPPAPAVTASARAPASQPQAAAPAAVAEATAVAPAERARRVAQLAELANQAKNCQGCALHQSRNESVFADGDAMARIVIVGEAPGAEEDASGTPFVGRAGQMLNAMLSAIGIDRAEVYICNTLKCRPPQNRDPLPAEKEACEKFLIAQLVIIRPCLLVALGAHAANALCGTKNVAIGKLRGRWHSYNGIPLLATYHPSFLLRPNGIPYKHEAWKDFQEIHRKYCELNPHDPRPIWKKPAGGE